MYEDIISTQCYQDLPFNISLTGTSYCDGSYHINRECSKELCIEYIEKGCGTVHHGKSVFHPKEGEVYILHIGQYHNYYSDAKNPWTKIWFNAQGELCERLLSAYGLATVTHVKNCDISPFIRQIHEICSDKGITHRERQRASAVVFHQLVQMLSESVNAVSKTTVAQTVKEYIDAHYSEFLTVENFASVAGLSQSQTIRIFSKEYGITPYDYLLGVRIEQARLLLRSTSLKVKEISNALAFTDEHYFSTVFKKKTGKSPLQYRDRK